jgi:hypothetical protein
VTVLAPLAAALTLLCSDAPASAPPSPGQWAEPAMLEAPAPPDAPAPGPCPLAVPALGPGLHERAARLKAYLEAMKALEKARLEAARAELDGAAAAEDENASELAMLAAVRQLREVRSETLLTVPRATALEVSNFAGRIAVQAWKRNDVRIVAEHGRHDHLEPRLENGTLVIGVFGRHGEPAFGDVSVCVPEWMSMRLASIESAIDVEGVRAAIEAGSVRGDVSVRESRGPMQLRSVEGGVHVIDASGRVRCASINNMIRLVRVAGLIDAESVNGDIQLSQVESPDVDASSVNGSVDFSGPFQPRGRYRLASHRGNLKVGVPVGSGVDVSVASFKGAFESGFPVRVAPEARGRRFTFTLGGGGSSLELQSYQGRIQLLRDDESRAMPHPVPVVPAPPPPPAEEKR